jgi:hypothetical protein
LANVVAEEVPELSVGLNLPEAGVMFLQVSVKGTECWPKSTRSKRTEMKRTEREASGATACLSTPTAQPKRKATLVQARRPWIC